MENYFKAYRRDNPAVHAIIMFDDESPQDTAHSLRKILAIGRGVSEAGAGRRPVQYSVFREYKGKPTNLSVVGKDPVTNPIR